MSNYFEDMWIALEDELKQYDSFESNSNFIDFSNNPIGQTEQPAEQSHLENTTYEQLLAQKEQPDPSYQQLHSTDRSQRIQAIKELYNKYPTIISWASLLQLKKTANNLYKQGRVKQANRVSRSLEILLKTAESLMKESKK